MKQFIREYFTFNKRERNGIFVLLSIIILLIIYLSIADCFIQDESVDFSEFEKAIQALNHSAEERKGIRSTTNHPTFVKQNTITAQRFLFNPNGLSAQEWKRLGLNDNQIASIKRYELKGGTFKNKNDVKKMWSISSALYKELEPYILIPEEKNNSSVSLKNKNDPPAITMIELNSADSIQLLTIKGIGPYFAKNILKYKKALGGYYSIEQLLEVWKFDEEKYQQVKNFIRVDASMIHKKNINSCTAEDLKHPYIPWNVAHVIINYRMKHGNYRTVEEVKKTGLIDEKAFLRMAPYLNVGN
jgi:DNA uptake protein ComE-like DNA-binding protein